MRGASASSANEDNKHKKNRAEEEETSNANDDPMEVDPDNNDDLGACGHWDRCAVLHVPRKQHLCQWVLQSTLDHAL